MALVIAGAFLGLIYVARTILSARSENRHPSGLDQLIVLAMTGVLTVAVVTDNQQVSQTDMVELAVAALGLVFALFSLMTLVLGRRENSSDDARGFLGIGIGLIILAMAFGVPLLNRVAPAPDEVAFVVPTAINDVAGNSSGNVNNRRVTNTSNRVSVAPTQTPLALDSNIPTPPPPDIYFFTPTPTPQGLACTGVVTTDLNVRRYPTVAEGNVVAVAAEDEEVLILGRTEVNSWWFISFDIYEGWVDAGFVDLNDDCEDVTIPARPWS